MNLLRISFLFLLLASSAFFFTCKSRKSSAAEDLALFNDSKIAYKDYISSFTSGLIPRNSVIRVRFKSDVVGTNELGKEAGDIIKFTPELKGRAVWENPSTLRFDPENWLPHGQTIRARIALKPFFPNIASNISNFDFAFRAMPQHLDISVQSIKENSSEDLEKLQLEGVLHTADVAKPEDVQVAMKARQEGNKDIQLSWQHAEDMKTHRFSIKNIRRHQGEGSGKMFLRWNGQPLGIDRNGTDTIEVPGQGFKVLLVESRKNEEEGTYIFFQFSKPVDAKSLQEGIEVYEKNYWNDEYQSNNSFNHYNFLVDGSTVKCYSKSESRSLKFVLKDRLSDISGKFLVNKSEFKMDVDYSGPALRLVGDGVITPRTKGLYFPFEAIHLKAVDVEVFKIYENNVLHFLQNNDWDNQYSNYVGRIILQKRILLGELNPKANLSTWTRYALDLDKLIQQEPGAIYQIRLAFKKDYTDLPCVSPEALSMKSTEPNYVPNEETGEYDSFFDYHSYDYYDYDYNKRDDPCEKEYYTSSLFIRRNVFASNLGIIAKRGKNKELLIAVTDLLTTAPVAGAQIELFDIAHQRLSRVATGNDGTVKVKTERQALFLVANLGSQKGYLRLRDGESLSLSRFDVSGSSVSDFKGIKGEIYGERGVWRPGDSLYLTVVLESKYSALPPNYPVALELVNPKGQVVERKTVGQHLNGVFNFPLATAPDAPTGTWQARVKAGGLSFSKNLKIETIKPNRLKINFDLGKKELYSADKNLNATLSANWLHGAVAKNLKAKVDIQLNQVSTSFDKYKDFVFDDPTRRDFSAEPFTLFESNVDENGQAAVNGILKLAGSPSGKMNAAFTIRVFENGGEFSIDNFRVPFSPYPYYVGVRVPKDQYGEKQLKINASNKINLVSLTEQGKPAANRTLKVGIYRLEWRWWWDGERYENLNQYNSTEHAGSLEQLEVVTDANGNASYNFTPKEWGRYMIRVCDNESGHCSGTFFYAGTPWEDAEFSKKEAASMLAFSCDKETYKTGDEIQLNVPTGKTGRALVSLENGRGILQHFWTDIKDNKEGVQIVKIKATPEMSPTVYAHVTLLQPHANVENDLPIRSYGVIPLQVENPATRLKPQLDMATVLKPGTTAKLNIKEAQGKAMTYTIAMVDEGLLDLTRFKTPDLWEHFYKKDALGVQTWDMYAAVLGAYGIQLDRIIAVGGDADLAAQTKKPNRFKPMVRYLGPFYLEAGKSAVHQVEIPEYIGSVRTMVVASHQGSYGSTEKTVAVRKPLMVLATLPRVLSPKEQFSLPVTIFAMESQVKNVKVEVKCSGSLQINGGATQTVSFKDPGDALLDFKVDVAAEEGVGKVTVIATSGSEKAIYETEILIRNPNPILAKTYDAVIDPKKEWSQSISPLGIKGSNRGVIEISSIPPLNLNKRLNYLIQYPYGCLEQTVSTAFPQLYVANLMELSPDYKLKIDQNIKLAIRKVCELQNSSGGFAYWPGDEANNWGSSYAGHFLLEAEAKGYSVPKEVLSSWKNYQSRMANQWTYPSGKNIERNAVLLQCYRLYTLALAKSPELPEMNTLLEKKDLPLAAKWRLAAAFALAGKTEAAKRITNNLSMSVEPYIEWGYSFGSDLRDEAMILETLTLMKEREDAADMLRRISDKLAKEDWYSTQTTAYCLMAIGKFVGNNTPSSDIRYSYNINGSKVQATLNKPIARIPLGMDAAPKQDISIKNESGQMLFVRVLSEGKPEQGDSKELTSNIKIDIAYQTLDGKALNPSSIPQGTDFVAVVKISHPGKKGDYKELALNQIFPSGWEIINSRMNAAFEQGSSNVADYQDIRDDRVYTFFDLDPGKSKTYKIYLNAAYKGRFYLPNQSCEAMYDRSIYANKAGQWVTVAAGTKENM